MAVPLLVLTRQEHCKLTTVTRRTTSTTTSDVVLPLRHQTATALVSMVDRVVFMPQSGHQITFAFGISQEVEFQPILQPAHQTQLDGACPLQTCRDLARSTVTSPTTKSSSTRLSVVITLAVSGAAHASLRPTVLHALNSSLPTHRLLLMPTGLSTPSRFTNK